jgi:hypothetical protein
MQIPVTTSGRIHPYHPNMRPRLYSRRLFKPAVLLVTVASLILAQDSSVLTNTGDPMHLAYACAEEDLQWAGMSCTEDDPCPIYLELSSIAPNGRKIVIAGNLHSTSATLSSILLMSDDAGATWKEPAARIRGSALDQIQFYNLQAGWAAGETQYPLPRDPYFLITTDGGSSWRQALIGEEGSAGAIQRFWFDSATHGELIVDAGRASAGGRYHSYESQTGGGNWTLTGKSDQLPRLRQAPPAGENPDWRLRTTRDGKSYDIEQRAGNKWTAVASFLINFADCKAKVNELKEPEPPADVPPVPAPIPPPAKGKPKK